MKNIIFFIAFVFVASAKAEPTSDIISPEVLDAGEDQVRECYECVFPRDWLESVQDQLVPMSGEDGIEVPDESPEIGILVVTRATYPVLGPSYFISGLGDRRSGGRRHMGVDLGAKSGTPVGAAWPGRVVWSGSDRLGGHVVKIMHPNGLNTYYAHLKYSPKVRDGQLLTAAQVLGAVGNSGNARWTVPHLHFEVRRGKSVLNPLNYIKKPSSRRRG